WPGRRAAWRLRIGSRAKGSWRLLVDCFGLRVRRRESLYGQRRGCERSEFEYGRSEQDAEGPAANAAGPSSSPTRPGELAPAGVGAEIAHERFGDGSRRREERTLLAAVANDRVVARVERVRRARRDRVTVAADQ